MLMHQLVAAATRIGMLTREHDTGAACTQALYELQHAVPYDAVSLLGIAYVMQRRYEIAEPELRKGCELCRRVLGPDYVITLLVP